MDKPQTEYAIVPFVYAITATSNFPKSASWDASSAVNEQLAVDRVISFEIKDCILVQKEVLGIGMKWFATILVHGWKLKFK